MGKQTIKSTLFLTAALLVGGLAGCSREDASEAASPADDIALGKTLFNDNCTDCHNRSGRGDYLNRIPATLLTRRSASELATWIEGRDMHREMPSFTDLSNQEREALAAYLLSQIGR